MRYLVFFSLCMLWLTPVKGHGTHKNRLGRGLSVKGQRDSINLYLNFQDIWGLDLKDGTFSANFYTLMESNGKRASDLQYLNGQINNRYFDTTRKPYYEAWNFGQFRTDINFKDYPLDKQYLNIVIEAGESIDQTILYTSDKENNIIGEPHLDGWKIDSIASKTIINTYKHFDYVNLHENHQYSRIVFTIVIERTNKWIFLLKLFFPSFISMLILMIGFLIPVERIETRFGLGVASIFGVISSLLLIEQDLPSLSRFTLIEILNYIAIFTVFITLVVFGISHLKSKAGKNIKKFEHIAFIAIMLFYFICSIGIVLLRK